MSTATSPRPASIYEQHDAAFNRVAAYVILDPAEPSRVATVAFKFPADGAGRLYCYLHVLGTPMVRGHAGGYGYDKRSAAAEAAASKLAINRNGLTVDGDTERAVTAIKAALKNCGGDDWSRALERAGYHVMQAV